MGLPFIIETMVRMERTKTFGWGVCRNRPLKNERTIDKIRESLNKKFQVD